MRKVVHNDIDALPAVINCDLMCGPAMFDQSSPGRSLPTTCRCSVMGLVRTCAMHCMRLVRQCIAGQLQVYQLLKYNALTRYI